MSAANDNDERTTGGKCPICGRPSLQRWRPFCSKRCADVDLARWMTGRYAIPGGDADEDEDGDTARAEDFVRRGGGSDAPPGRDEE